MTIEKKKDIIGVVIFLAVTFTIMMSCGFKGYDPDSDTTYAYWLAAFSPMIGCIVARLCLKEGFKDGILYPKFTGHFRGYLLAIALPLVWAALSCITVTIATGAGFSFKQENGFLTAIAGIALMSDYAYFAAVVLLGEELGWRAFLYDKLERVFGLNVSILIGGIIWGLWHIPPLVVMGINYGKDYPGFPYVGIALMCVLCVGFGAMLQMLRKLTDSMVAPLIAHALIDSVCNAVITIFFAPTTQQENAFCVGVCITVAACVVGIPCWVYMIRGSKTYKTGVHTVQ